MRIKVMHFLGVLILMLGIIGTPVLGRGSRGLWDCGSSGQSTCSGG